MLRDRRWAAPMRESGEHRRIRFEHPPSASRWRRLGRRWRCPAASRAGTRGPDRRRRGSASPRRPLRSPRRFVRESFEPRRRRRTTRRSRQAEQACETMPLALRFLAAENEALRRSGLQMAVGTLARGRRRRDVAAIGPVLRILPLARAIFAICFAEITLLAHHVKSGDLVFAEMPGFIQEHFFRPVLPRAPGFHHDDGAVRITAVLPGDRCHVAVNHDNGFGIGVLRRAEPPEGRSVIFWKSDAVYSRRPWIFRTGGKNSKSESRGNEGRRAPGHVVLR